MKISAIICAAGRGERAGFERNKLLAPLDGAPALFHTLEKFDIPLIDEVIVAASPVDFGEIGALCAHFGYRMVEGGSTRTMSVFNALKQCSGDIVLIHDGARPYVSQQIIEECARCAAEYGSAICAIPVTDTVVVATGNEISSVPDRSTLYAVQTPQAFDTGKLSEAYSKAIDDGATYTDDSAIYRRYVGRPRLCRGSRDNIKLTFKEDFAGTYPSINAAKGQAVGIGIDVHCFGKEQNFVTLCGVKIAHECGLIAHSDGDVAVHAVMDALLSAAGLRDIGFYFPDNDPAYGGADSIKLLEQVVGLIGRQGYRPVNLSLTIRAEKPRLAAHIEAMKDNLAAALNIDRSRIGISAGTSEKLGFVGRGLGIEAAAAALLERKDG